MEDEIVKQALNSMVDDIKLTMRFDDTMIITHRTIMSIVCCDKQSLNNAIEVFKKLDIRSAAILFIPKTFKDFKFDTIDVAEIFGCLKTNNPNISSILIHDSDRMSSGDFTIDIFVENTEYGTNDYIGYQSLSRYCNNVLE